MSLAEFRMRLRLAQSEEERDAIRDEMIMLGAELFGYVLGQDPGKVRVAIELITNHPGYLLS